jgi:hypothetical protein
MARNYSNSKRSGGVRLYGFEELVAALQRAEQIAVDAAAQKCFDKCSEIAVDALNEKMEKADVPASIKNAASTFKYHSGNIYMFSYGWGKSDKDTFNKVCYLNYGTPPRYTKKGAYRGKIEARGFISNAKRAAAQKMRKAQKDALKEMLGDINL